MTEAAPQAPPAANIAPGTILAGKYRVAKILGRGGMGIVVEAHHIQLDDRVALKFLLPEYATHPEASERFLREARAAVKIKSEHVARVSDVGTLDTGAPFMVMEYLEGSDLSSQLDTSGPLAVADAVDYIIQACDAIHEAHSYGIVHRDIKPANLFVTRRGDGLPLVKVLDFGISKTMGGGVDGLTKTTATMGSALYMSPEQMRQSRSVDSRTDVYSLGISLYELLAGKQPFYANTLPELCAEVLTGNPTPLLEVRGDLPHDFAVVLERAYARSLDHRYQSVIEFCFALAPYAPPRSQPLLDRFARFANQAPPRAGAPNPNVTQIAPGPYNAAVPMSQRAQAAFAGGQAQGGRGSYSGVGPMPGAPVGSSSGISGVNLTTTAVPKNGGAAVAVAAVLAIVLGGGGFGAWWYLRNKAPEGGDVPTVALPQDKPTTDVASPPPTTEALDPVPTATATSVATAEPTATASAADTSHVAVGTRPTGRPPVRPPVTAKPTSTPTVTPPVTATARPTSNAGANR